jgi:multidrug transporter EmrE-like cation transporter
MSPVVFVVMSTILGISGQLMLKRGMSVMVGTSGKALLMRVATSPWVVGGLFVYGCGVIFWLLALSRWEISYVYPFASLGYVGIILGSYWLFKERLSLLRLVGIAVIILGVLITSQT